MYQLELKQIPSWRKCFFIKGMCQHMLSTACSIVETVCHRSSWFSLTNENSLQCDEVRACLNMHAKRRRSYQVVSFERFQFVLAGKWNSSSENDNTEMNAVVLFLVFALKCWKCCLDTVFLSPLHLSGTQMFLKSYILLPMHRWKVKPIPSTDHDTF